MNIFNFYRTACQTLIIHMIPDCFLAQRYKLAKYYNKGAKYFFYPFPIL